MLAAELDRGLGDCDVGSPPTSPLPKPKRLRQHRSLTTQLANSRFSPEKESALKPAVLSCNANERGCKGRIPLSAEADSLRAQFLWRNRKVRSRKSSCAERSRFGVRFVGAMPMSGLMSMWRWGW
jgi:hypothetical protein